jgi:hypothetical protein
VFRYTSTYHDTGRRTLSLKLLTIIVCWYINEYKQSANKNELSVTDVDVMFVVHLFHIETDTELLYRYGMYPLLRDLT